jgi:hypothetical protein
MTTKNVPAQQNHFWPPGTTDPGSAAAEPLLRQGDIYYNTGSLKLRKCDNPTYPATWSSVGSPSLQDVYAASSPPQIDFGGSSLLFKDGSNTVLNLALAGVSVGSLTSVVPLAVHGIVTVNAGTAALPSLSWITDPDTGVYSAGANVLGLSAGGSLRLSVSTAAVTSTLPFYAPDGAAATPSYVFTSDTDTGFYSGGTNKLGIATGGTARLFFDSSTASFSVPVYGVDGGAGSPALSFNNDPNTGLYSVAADTLGISTNGVLRLAISTTGIDAVLPYRAPSGTAGAPGYEFVSDNTSGMFLPGAGIVAISTAGAERVRFTATDSTLTGNWLPEADNTRNLGSAGLQWAQTHSNVFYAGSGSGAAPAYTFAAFPLVGFFASSVNDLYLAMQGQARFVFGVGGFFGVTSTNNPLVLYGNPNSFADGVQLTAGTTYQGFAGNQNAVRINATVAQTGTAGFTGIDINITETTLGSDPKYIINAKAGAAGTTQVFAITHTGQVLLPDGSFGAPAIASLTTPDAGWFCAAGGWSFVASGGIQVVDLHDDGIFTYVGIQPNTDNSQTLGGSGTRWAEVHSVHFYGANGTTGLPTYSFDTQADSGMYLKASSKIAFVTPGYGGEQLIIDGSSGDSQILFAPGSGGVPGLACMSDPDTGIDHNGPIASSDLTLQSHGYLVAAASGVGAAFIPGADNTYKLGTSSFRWSDVFAVQTTIGDLTMKNPNGGPEHWKLIEGLDEIWAYNVRTRKKYKIGMVEAEVTEADRQLMVAEEARFHE